MSEEWAIYQGDNEVRRPDLPLAPPWRRFDKPSRSAVIRGNLPTQRRSRGCRQRCPASASAAVVDRRSGLGEVLSHRCGRPRVGPGSGAALASHLPQHSQRRALSDDAIGRMHATNIDKQDTAIGDYLRLGPRHGPDPQRAAPALLVDQIDKSDIDLPNDLLNVFERGELKSLSLPASGGDSGHPGGRRRCARYDHPRQSALSRVPLRGADQQW